MNKSSVAKNTLIAVVIAVAGIVAFTGCGQNKGAGSEAIKTAEKGIAYIETRPPNSKRRPKTQKLN
jgi:hypothetical protein